MYDLKTIARFYNKINFDGATAPGMGSPCWEWAAYRNKGGYSKLKVNGRDMLAHRFAYELLVGPIPEGLHIDHHCHTRHCVNPDHLEPVTNKQNIERQAGAQRSNKSSGIRGVSWFKSLGKWQVHASHNGKCYYGGCFTDLVEAEKAAIALRSKLFGADPVRREQVLAS